MGLEWEGSQPDRDCLVVPILDPPFKLGSHSRALKMGLRVLLDLFTALSNMATLNESFSAFYFNLAFLKK